MDREEKILQEIEKLEREYAEKSKLNIYQNPGFYDANTDMKYGFENELVQGGTNVELDNIQYRIMQLKDELERVRSFSDTRISNKPEEMFVDEKIIEEDILMEQERKKQEKEEHRKFLEEERKQTFIKVKLAYKKSKGYGFDRFMNVISGKSPKWNKISRYSQKELDFLLATFRGETNSRRHSISSIEAKKDLSFAEKKKRVADSNWREFNLLLQKKAQLSDLVKSSEKRGRSY